ncbi:MAG: hypothetical protein ACYTGC_11295, partial [Planctomycetota bacterium]
DVAAQTRSIRTADEGKALAATREGFGMLVQALVAEAGGLSSANEQLLALMSLAGIDRAEARPVQRRYQELYRAGLNLMRAQLEQGGIERVWATLARPPATYGQVRDPETYGRPVATEVSLERLFAGVRDMFGPGQWIENSVSIDGQGVGMPFLVAGQAAAREIVEQVTVVHTLVLNDMSGRIPRVRSISCFELVDPAFGARLMEHQEVVKEAQFQRMRGLADGDRLMLEEPATVAIAGLDVEESRLYRISVRPREEQAEAGVPSIDLALGAARQGRYLVHVVASGGVVSDATMRDSISTVLQRMIEGAAEVPLPEVDRSDPLIAMLDNLEARLPETRWRSEYREVSREGAAVLIGQDVGSQVALELGFERGQACHREEPARRDGPRRSIAVTVIQMKDAEVAGKLAGPMLEGSRQLMSRFRGLPGVTLTETDLEPRPVGIAGTLSGFSAEIAMPGRRAEMVTVYVAYDGRHLVQVIDTNGALDVEGVAQYLGDSFNELQAAKSD